MRDKRQLTEQLIQLLPDDQRITVESAIGTWWFNLRKNGGMRLTTAGYQTFRINLQLENYQYEIDDPLTFNQRLILKLDRRMQMPYYIHAVKGIPKKIVFFGSREAMLARLYGDLDKFLSNY